MSETEYCTQCGRETLLPMLEGVCGDCHADNYTRLQKHNAQYDHWQTLTDNERDAAIKDACAP